MNQTTPFERKLFVSCDVDNLNSLNRILNATSSIPRVGGYKLGFELGLGFSLSKTADLIRNLAPYKKIVYDHQKGGTDIPQMGKRFARLMKFSGVDSAILFPFTGPVSQEYWIKSLQDNDIDVIVGGEMTHPKFLRSEGGYIADEAVLEMYTNAAVLGVRSFVVPGNKLDSIKTIRNHLEDNLQVENPLYYAPGFVAQKGDISETTRVIGDRFYPIVGRGIYWDDTRERCSDEDEIRGRTIDLISQM